MQNIDIVRKVFFYYLVFLLLQITIETYERQIKERKKENVANYLKLDVASRHLVTFTKVQKTNGYLKRTY